MEQQREAGTPCEACLDWRLDQTRRVGAHIAEVVRNIVTDLGLDPTDERVREVMGRRLREASAGTAERD